MPAYDAARFSPPAPVARVILRNAVNPSVVTEVEMLMDSGADVTLIPTSAVRFLNITVNPDEGYELMGFDGQTSLAQAVTLDLVFDRRTFKGKFLLIEQDWGILGRDVLNHLTLVFDGPKLFWEES